MKPKPISGEPLRDKYALPPSQAEKQYNLDFVYSNSLNEIEAGIKEAARGVNMSILTIAMAFVKIDREALYAQAGYKSYLQYLDQAEERISMPRQTISDYKRIGDAFFDHKAELQGSGFKSEGHLHKLRYLERALENHASEEVFKRIGTDSFRRFKEFAEGTPPSERSDEKPRMQYLPEIHITQKRIMVDGKNILNFPKDLDGRIKEELADYLKKIYEIRATGNKPYVLNVYDEQEAQAVEGYLRRHRLRR